MTNQFRTVAVLIPAKVRRALYVVLPTLFAIEAIVDIVPAGIESKAVAILAVLGFGVASANVPRAR